MSVDSQVQAHGTPGRSSLGSRDPGRWGPQGREDSIPPRPEAYLVLIWMKVRVQHLKSGGEPQSDSGGSLVSVCRKELSDAQAERQSVQVSLGSGGAPPELEEPSGTFMVSSTAAHRQPVLSRYL